MLRAMEKKAGKKEADGMLERGGGNLLSTPVVPILSPRQPSFLSPFIFHKSLTIMAGSEENQEEQNENNFECSGCSRGTGPAMSGNPAGCSGVLLSMRISLSF